jgi:NADH-quinone oxidoreductase subunit H
VFAIALGVIWFVAKMFGFLFLYFWLRASLPRFRYDQLMHFGWKFLVPVSLANIFIMGIYFAVRNGWFRA